MGGGISINANAKLISSGAKGLGKGGGRAPPDYFFIPLLGRTHEHFKITRLLKHVGDFFG
jgi:hypothetical protein